MELTDQQLLTDWCTRKDANAFQAIVQRHATMVFHTALRILKNPADAEDTAQQCFETLVTTEKIEHIQSLGAWLHGIVTKISLKHIRTASRRSQREKSYAEINLPQNDAQEWQEIYPLIDEAIQSLHEKFRAPIIAHFLEGQTHASIAQDLNVSRSTITSHINQGIQQIEATLKKKGILTTLALAPTLATQFANAAPVQPTLVANLGKLALTQGQGLATTASTFAIATTLKWVAAALIISMGTTLGLWKIMGQPEQPIQTAIFASEIPITPIPISVTAPVPTTQTQPTQNITLASALQEPAPEASITTAAVVTTDSDQLPTNVIHVAGIVKDTLGNPAPNAKVNAVWLSGETDVVTDAHGRFTIPLHRNLFNEGELVIIREVNYQNDVYEVPVRAEVHGDTLVGYLDTPLGQFPLSGTRTSQGEGAFGTWDVVITYNNTDYAGEFILNQDPDGAIYGEWTDELGPPTLSSFVVPEKIRLSATFQNEKAFEHDFDVPTDGRDDITLALITPATVNGRMIDSDGNPLPDWTISIVNDDGYANGKSNADGRFTISDINPGEYFPSAYSPKNNARAERIEAITLTSTQIVNDFTLVYALGQTLTGYVTDTNNQPINGVRVSGVLSTMEKDRNGGLTSYYGQSKEDGSYELSGIHNLPGTEVDIQIYHEGYMQLRRPKILVDGSSVNFTLVGLPTIEGRVVDADTKEAIERFRLYPMTGGATDELPRLLIATGYELNNYDNGEFSTHPHGYGEVAIVASAPGYETTLHRLPYLQPGETRTDVLVALKPIEAIRGKVLDTNGEPIRGARIFLGQPPIISGPHANAVIGAKGIARSNRKGEFKITEYPPSAVDQISAHADGYAPAWTNVSQPFADVEITLTKGSHVEGTITHLGEPVGSAQASVNLSVNDRLLMTDETDDDGNFDFDMVPKQSVTLQVSFDHAGQFLAISRTFDPSEGELLPQIFDFDTQGDAFIEGIILVDDHAPHTALITATAILPNGEKLFYRTETKADGTYSLGPIHANTYEFGPRWIQFPDGSYMEPTLDTVTAHPNQTARHDVNIKTE